MRYAQILALSRWACSWRLAAPRRKRPVVAAASRVAVWCNGTPIYRATSEPVVKTRHGGKTPGDLSCRGTKSGPLTN